MNRTIPQEKALDQVIDWLQKGAPHVSLKDGTVITGFDYSTYMAPDFKFADNTGQCGTVACIAGAVRLFKTQSLASRDEKNEMATEYFASASLGLEDDEAEMLFYPFELNLRQITGYYSTHKYQAPTTYLDLGFGEEFFDPDDEEFLPLTQTRLASPQQVARVLLHFKNTGFIDWFILEP